MYTLFQRSFWGMTFGFQVLWSLLESQSEWLRCFPLLDFHVDKKVGKILGDETRVTLSFFFLLQKIFYWMRVVQSEACEEFFSLITPRQWKPWTMGVARKHLLFVSVSSFMLKGLQSVCLAPKSQCVEKCQKCLISKSKRAKRAILSNVSSKKSDFWWSLT